MKRKSQKPIDWKKCMCETNTHVNSLLDVVQKVYECGQVTLSEFKSLSEGTLLSDPKLSSLFKIVYLFEVEHESTPTRSCVLGTLKSVFDPKKLVVRIKSEESYREFMDLIDSYQFSKSEVSHANTSITCQEAAIEEQKHVLEKLQEGLTQLKAEKESVHESLDNTSANLMLYAGA